MKKLFGVLLVVVLMSGVAYGADNQMTYVIKNTGGTYLTTTIPQAAIRANYAKVLGFTVMGNSAKSENVVAVYDETVGRLSGECIGECESLPDTINGILLPKGKLVSLGCTVRQGPNTTVIVYYEV